jgi:hypothetical protein
LNTVRFINFNEDIINDIDTVTNCASLSSDKCSSKPYCLTSGDSCLLLIPKNNLITDIDNEIMYYGRIADEIVRYSRIRTFIFEPNTFLSFSELKYNLLDDEIILLQSLLKQEYYDDLVPRNETKYENYTTYETAAPIDGQEYNDIISNDNGKRGVVSLCLRPTINIIAGKWSKAFPTSSQELEFTNSLDVCTFDIITTILQVHGKEGKDMGVGDLRDVLVDEYASIYKQHAPAITGIMRVQGKFLMARKLEFDEIDIETLIMSEGYFLSPLDIWLISRRFNIPIVMIKSTTFAENDKNIIVCNSREKSFYFIKVPGVRQGIAPNYKLIVNEGSSLFNISDIGRAVSKEISVQQSVSDDLLISFLESFKPPKKKHLRIEEIQDVAEKPQPHRVVAEKPQPHRVVAEKPQPQPERVDEIVRDAEISLNSNRKRCPNGYRKNITTGKCKKNETKNETKK